MGSLPFAASQYGAIEQNVWVTARIQAYCGWHIAPTIETTVVLDTDGGVDLFLPTLHLTAVTSITDSVAGLIDPDDYEWSATGRVRSLTCGWPSRFRAVTVVFSHGYEEVPPQLVEVATAAAARVPAQIASVSQEAAGGVSRSYGGLLSGNAPLMAGWTLAEQIVLDKYRIGNRP